VKLCTEIRERVNFDDETLKFLSILNPKTMFDDDKCSLLNLISRFQNVVEANTINDLNMEWRLLSDFKAKKNIIGFNELREYLTTLKNGAEEPLFPNIIQFFKALSCLPHSGAAAERLFSQLSLIKTKPRNIDSCDALLLTKELLANQSCYDGVPPNDLINLCDKISDLSFF
jgi:hypothetical protein